VTVRGLLQDLLRRVIGEALVLSGHLLALRHEARIRGYRATQDRLRARYAVEPDTPVRTWGPEVQAMVEVWAEAQPKPVRFAETSGTTARPKRLAYPKRRVLLVQWAFVESFSRLYAAETLSRHSLYVFAAIDGDPSLTGMMLEEGAGPSYVSTLQAPYRAHGLSSMRRLAEMYGADAARLWVLALSNPGVLYATNPSTLSTFFDRVQANWREVTRLVRDWVRASGRFEPGVRAVAARLLSAGAMARLADLAAAERPLPLSAWAPAVELVVCWDGGYVAPFLERLDGHLDPDRHRRRPMYSMSTEVLETVPHYFAPGEQAFLPIAPRVLYELLPEGAEDDPAQLMAPWEAAPGERYTLVVSDAYGLVRYQTGDLFECVRLVDGLPDLRFVRRRDLEHSFTGEKLTAAQVQAAFHQLREAFGALEGTYLTLVPDAPTDGTPGYRLLVLAAHAPQLDLEALAGQLDAALCAANPEYASKRRTGRLAAPTAHLDPPDRFAARVSGQGSWESQFKFLPLYRRTWQSLCGDA